MKIKNKGKGKAEILIYEDIGEGWLGGISAKGFADMIKSEETENGKLTEINVRINSAGGSVFDGVAIYNTLKKHNARITVDIDGLAASIASIVAMAGDEVRAAENSMLMIHDPWLVTSGSADELRETAELLDKVRGQLLDTYTKRTGADEETISQMMTDETWMTASEAMDIGLIDSVTDEMQMAAHYDLTKFKHPPKNLATIASKGAASGALAKMGARLKARKLTASGQ